MQNTPAQSAVWPDPSLYEHFLKHHLGLGLKWVTEYEASARKTIEIGKRFTYTSKGGQPRVGYFHAATRRFTALTTNERRIISHFRANDENYPRGLPDSDYSP
jgi:hypothetical protein